MEPIRRLVGKIVAQQEVCVEGRERGGHGAVAGHGPIRVDEHQAVEVITRDE